MEKGDGIIVEYESNAEVKGNVSGGNAEGAGTSGNAVLVLTLLPVEAEMLTAGTVDIDGTVMGGTGNTPGSGIYYSLSYMLTYDVNETTDCFREEEAELEPGMYIMQIAMVSDQMAMSGLAIPDNIQDDVVFRKYLEDSQAEVNRLVAAGADEDALIEKAWDEAAKLDAEFDPVYTACMAGIDPAEYVKTNTLLISALSNVNGGAYVTSEEGSAMGEQVLAANPDNEVIKVNMEGGGDRETGDAGVNAEDNGTQEMGDTVVNTEGVVSPKTGDSTHCGRVSFSAAVKNPTHMDK